jgi:hypothetical protein
LVPINLSPETEITGPTSLNAINFITLGIPYPSDFGEVTVESFSLTNGSLSEQSGLSVFFKTIGGYDEIPQTSVLQASGCTGGCSQFCVDEDGYLVSVTPLGIPFPTKLT